MPETPGQISQPQRSLSVTATCKRAVQWIPLKARLAVLAGLLALIGLAVYTYLSSGSATLNLICHHNLRTAELSVSIDGKLSYTDQISGGQKKRFGIFGKQAQGTFSKSLALPSGTHVVQVRLRSPADGFDQTKRSGVNLLPGKEATLLIAAQRSGMSLVYQGPRVGRVTDADSDYSGSVRSMLLTVAGSILSAAIGFFVQEFLRSRRAAS